MATTMDVSRPAQPATMMDKAMPSITSINQWLHVAVITLVVWSQDRIQDLFQRLELTNFSLLGTLVFAFIGIHLIDRLAMLLIDKLRWVRRLLAGSSDIEGDWVDVIVDPVEPDRIVKAEYCRIRFSQGEYVITGHTWTPDGRSQGRFETQGGKFDNGRFTYYYLTGLRSFGGFGTATFTPNDSPPDSFTCRYIDEESKTAFVAMGRRLSARFRHVDQQEMRAAALNFANEVDISNLPRLDVL